ncbi:hypothetical protein [uncultured Dysosmobacter sp.]|uniref:hypothetical protein n=1 Tax=uncultured Dysosmobacter sp. TaxID=2591384 RepID=UPI00260BBD7D|nr:hypothetical protein [uncultured Dysosmobacter sp.]
MRQAKQLQMPASVFTKNGISESSKKGKRKDDEEFQKKAAIFHVGSSDGILYVCRQHTVIGSCPAG